LGIGLGFDYTLDELDHQRTAQSEDLCTSVFQFPTGQALRPQP